MHSSSFTATLMLGFTHELLAKPSSAYLGERASDERSVRPAGARGIRLMAALSL
jgi:hypothetical protein